MDVDGRDDDDSSVEGEQIRVSFVLDPSVSDRTLEVPTDPIAVPSSVRRKGLSAVVNHLLDRKVPRDDDAGDDSDEDDEMDDEGKLPAITFDFLVNGRLLRQGVEAVARREGLSLEQAVELRYFPASTAPVGDGDGEELPDWVTAMSYIEQWGGGGEGGSGFLCTGGADGVVRSFAASRKDFHSVASAKAHTGPVKCISSLSCEGGKAGNAVVASGSMDQTLMTHVLDEKTEELRPHAFYGGGHFSSLSSVELLRRSDGGVIMASGDWDGGLCVWDVPSTNEINNPAHDDDDKAAEKKKKKKRTKNGASSVTDATLAEVRPLSSFRAHASTISGIAYSHGSTGTTLLTGSWDHSLKVWDLNRQDCLLTLNGSRVVTALARCHNSDVIATGHPDCTVRLWDMRVSKKGGADKTSTVSDSTLKPSHKAWVAAVQWSPTNPYTLASASHDGTVKMWDIRSSLPLHTVRAHPKQEKGLCLAFAEGVIYSGGSDCVVKRFIC